ncbi:hypothetical protein J3F84DRAFT_364955 [Trichoderma pleuroticola]
MPLFLRNSTTRLMTLSSLLERSGLIPASLLLAHITANPGYCGANFFFIYMSKTRIKHMPKQPSPAAPSNWNSDIVQILICLHARHRIFDRERIQRNMFGCMELKTGLVIS